MRRRQHPALNPVYLVIDEPQARDRTEKLFRLYFPGHRLEVFDSGSQLMTKLDRRPPEPPLLVLLDLQHSPEKTLAVLTRLKAHAYGHYIPVVVFPPAATAAEIAAYYGAGANSCVIRVTDEAQLVASLTIVFDYWLQVNVRGNRDYQQADPLTGNSGL